ncbi:LCP family protein [Nocardioides sp.]|uniref:LCP family protein n=1 Tax=Nocardioides sp. TaxID=35761 RepID=UPI001A188192|nr:LCP family protein [Nocardioides sp.]MBJ7357425.1 LCP family protein [Nocardioides sp.]
MTGSTPRTRRFRRWLTPVLLGLVLAVATLTVPDSTVRPADMTLVEVDRATSVDVNPDVLWILAVGSDARPGEEMTRTRGDALQLVGINTRTGAATAIGIPRDSYVPIPGVGSDRVNAAMYYGGPQLLGETVGNLVGVQPEYVFVTGFKTFQKMVTSIGGFYVHNPVAFSDSSLKPSGFKKGKIRLGGYTSLAFARSRKALLGGDFDRSANQQRILRGIHHKIRQKAGTRGFLERGVLSAMANMETNVSPAVLYRIAHAITTLRARKFTTCVVQGAIGNVGGASVVLPYVDQARRYGDEARDDATLERC